MSRHDLVACNVIRNNDSFLTVEKSCTFIFDLRSTKVQHTVSGRCRFSFTLKMKISLLLHFYIFLASVYQIGGLYVAWLDSERLKGQARGEKGTHICHRGKWFKSCHHFRATPLPPLFFCPPSKANTWTTCSFQKIIVHIWVKFEKPYLWKRL